MDEEIEILISLALSLEKERARQIVNDVSNEIIGGKCDVLPTEFMSGYQTACEEILHRMQNEEWELCGEVFDKVPNVQIEGLAATKRERSPESSKNRRP